MSSCTGNKKALLIGINYTGTKNALRGCINDVQMIKQHLLLNGFRPDIQSTLVLTDDATDAMLRPTRQNILQAMAWLVRGAKSGDSLFLHFR